MKRHLVFGFEGLLRRVMYVFDDAVVFVDPPPSVKAADALRLGLRKATAAHVPTFKGESVVTKSTAEYVKQRKFKDIAAFSRQFGEAGFSDPRITSTMMAEQLTRAARLPHSEIVQVHFVFDSSALYPHVVLQFICRGTTSPVEFCMRDGTPKVREAHQALAAVLGPRVSTLNPS
jgi:hypothetical protein